MCLSMYSEGCLYITFNHMTMPGIHLAMPLAFNIQPKTGINTSRSIHPPLCFPFL